MTDLATGKLAIDGGDLAVVDPLPPMCPGGLRIGDAICYFLVLPDAEQASRVEPALAAEGVRGAVIKVLSALV